MKEIQISRKEIQIFRNEIQAEAEQIPNPAERNPNSHHLLSLAFSKTWAKPSQAFLHFCADSGFECRGNVGVACSPRVVRRPFGLPSRFLRSSRASEGLAPFTIADGVLVRRVGAVSARPHGRGASLRNPGVRGSPGYEPGDRGPAEKDRPIDPMCGKNSPA